MPKLKTTDLVNAISTLNKDRVFKYYSGLSKLKITDIEKPEGPIGFVRWRSNELEQSAKSGSISTSMLTMAASVFSGKPNYPIHLDRLFSAGGNSRSAFETLLVHTPHFFISYPQRTNPYTGELDTPHKHVMWCPDDSHELASIGEKDFNEVISEIELGLKFGDIDITPNMLDKEFDTIEAKKTHTQMQVAIVEIGNALKFQTWIAKNDRSIQVGKTNLGKLKGVIDSLEDVPILYTKESKKRASLIDCIWFSQDFKYIPAVIEVEHSTGVTSGLTRMLKFQKSLPSVSTKYTIIAPNRLRNKVVTETNSEVYRAMNGRYMSYSTVRELYGLIQKYSLLNVIEYNFIEPFMEKMIDG